MINRKKHNINYYYYYQDLIRVSFLVFVAIRRFDSIKNAMTTLFDWQTMGGRIEQAQF